MDSLTRKSILAVINSCGFCLREASRPPTNLKDSRNSSHTSMSMSPDTSNDVLIKLQYALESDASFGNDFMKVCKLTVRICVRIEFSTWIEDSHRTRDSSVIFD